jgi:hypothetical protein
MRSVSSALMGSDPATARKSNATVLRTNCDSPGSCRQESKVCAQRCLDIRQAGSRASTPLLSVPMPQRSRPALTSSPSRAK